MAKSCAAVKFMFLDFLYYRAMTKCFVFCSILFILFYSTLFVNTGGCRSIQCAAAKSFVL